MTPPEVNRPYDELEEVSMIPLYCSSPPESRPRPLPTSAGFGVKSPPSQVLLEAALISTKSWVWILASPAPF
jgi:hypothetical protein